MKIPAPAHSTIVAYLALFVALAGSAYAVSNVGSADIENRSIKGKDVANDTLGGRQVDQAKLGGPSAVGDEQSGTCDPAPAAPADCVTRTIVLRTEGALLVVATASKSAQLGSGVCVVTVDGTQSNSESLGGSESDGFALTKVTSPLDPGSHTVALRCTEANTNLRIDNPTIAAVAVGSP
jgi:hypothetical protein